MPLNFICDAPTLAQHVSIGVTPEGLHLDFKGTVHNWDSGTQTERQEARLEICRDVSQFANTDGGTLLLGVQETRNQAGIKVASLIKGIAEPDKLRAWIEQAVTNHCVPSTFSHNIHFIPTPQGTVVTVTVHPHVHTVYVWHVDAMQVIARTSHGKKYMNPNEVERHIMNGSRASRLAFEAARAAATNKEVCLAGGIWKADAPIDGGKWRRIGTHDIHLGDTTETTFDLRIPIGNAIRVLTIPYGLLDEVWVDAQLRLNVFLRPRLLYMSDEITFGPMTPL